MNRFWLFILYFLGVAILCLVGGTFGFWAALFVFLLFAGGYFIFKKSKISSINQKTQDAFYAQVAIEVQSKDFKPDIVARAAAESNGNKDLAQSLYIKYRVEQLMTDFKGRQSKLNRELWMKNGGSFLLMLVIMVIVRTVVSSLINPPTKSSQMPADAIPINQFNPATAVPVSQTTDVPAGYVLDNNLEDNAKQIIVTKSSLTLPPPDDNATSQADTIEVTLKNIGFNVVERVDLAIKWSTKDGYFENEEEMNDFTGGQLITPKSEGIIKDVVTLQKHTVDETFSIYVKRVKFRDYIYHIGRQSLPIDGFPKAALLITDIQRFDNMVSCENFLNDNKSNYVEAKCSPQNEAITKMIDYEATSEQYCVQYVKYNGQPIKMFIDIAPKWVKAGQDTSFADGFIQKVKENGGKGFYTCVSPQGVKHEYFDNFDEANIIDNSTTSTGASRKYYLIIKTDDKSYPPPTDIIQGYGNLNSCNSTLDGMLKTTKYHMECQPYDSKVEKIFFNQPIEDWYLRLDPTMKMNLNVAMVFNFKVKPNEDTVFSLAQKWAKGAKANNPKMEALLISPDGRTWNY